jgi:hypothetical protein
MDVYGRLAGDIALGNEEAARLDLLAARPAGPAGVLQHVLLPVDVVSNIVHNCEGLDGCKRVSYGGTSNFFLSL